MVDTDKTGEADLGKLPATADVPAAPIPQTSETPRVEPEAHIIEETITRAAPKTPPALPVPNILTAPAPPHASERQATLRDPAIGGTDIAKILEGVKLSERRAGDEPTNTKTSPPEIKQQAVETQPATAPDATPHLTEEKQRGIVSSVHTLKNDLQNVIRNQKISVVRAVSLEEDRRAHETGEPRETPAATKRSKRTFAIIFSVVLLCVIGGSALFAVYTIMRERTGSSSPEIDSSILFAEQSTILPLSNYSSRDLKRALAETRVSSAGTLGSIVRIIPVVAITNPDSTVQNTPASFSEFIRAIGARPPDELIRALGSEFFFGIHTVDENAPLIIVPVMSYDHAFAGMLAWEAALNADLAPVFTSVPSLITGPNGIPSKRIFQDLVMRNYDVRALKDDAEEIQLYYSFPSQRMLVIAESPYSFTEILSRLQAGQKL